MASPATDLHQTFVPRVGHAIDLCLTFDPRIGLAVVLVVEVKVCELPKGVKLSLRLVVELEIDEERDTGRPHLQCLVGVECGLPNLTQTLPVGRQKPSRQLQGRKQTARGLHIQTHKHKQAHTNTQRKHAQTCTMKFYRFCASHMTLWEIYCSANLL